MSVRRGSVLEVLAGFEVVERLRAIIRELEPRGDGAEVATALASGLLEELEAAVAEGDES